MANLVRALLLVAGMTGLLYAGAGLSASPAQDKKVDSKKDTKAADKGGTVEIHKDQAGDYRFRIKDADGKVVAMSTKGYETKDECHKALDFVKATLNAAKVTEAKDEKK